MSVLDEAQSASRFDGEFISELRRISRIAAASVLHDRVREIEAEIKHAFVELGLICIAVEDGQLYDCMDPQYPSFGAWITAAMPSQHSSAYAAKAAIRLLQGTVSEADMREMPRCNIETLSRCSSAVARNPEVQAKAKILSQNEFVRTLAGQFPEQHLEERNSYRLTFTKSQREIIDGAISAIRVLEEDDSLSREECLWHLARTFLEDHEDELLRKANIHKLVTEAVQ